LYGRGEVVQESEAERFECVGFGTDEFAFDARGIVFSLVSTGQFSEMMLRVGPNVLMYKSTPLMPACANSAALAHAVSRTWDCKSSHQTASRDLDRLLDRSYRQDDTVRFVKLLQKQHVYLFTFLYHDAVAPTNNAAERELRPAVIIRKTNRCNRNSTGATVHTILASVIRTAHKHGHDFVGLTKRVLQQPRCVVVHLGNSASSPPIVAAATTHANSGTASIT
jgi:hypothetical protein